MKYFLLFLFVTGVNVFAEAQAVRDIDVQHYRFAITINDSNNIIQGQAFISFKATRTLNKVAFDLVAVNAIGKGMQLLNVSSNNKNLQATQTSEEIVIDLDGQLQLGEEKTIQIDYKGIPADGLIISTNKFGHRTIFSDNWPNRAHNWIPCADHPSDKASVEFIVTAPIHYGIISNGIEIEEINLEGKLKQVHYREDVPLPTKVMAIGLADFAIQRSGEVDCIPVSSWVFPENKDQGFSDYAIAKTILPFFIEKVGPYAYHKLANVQSKTMFGGMENASAIFYSENSVKDDTVLIEPLITHEIAHQWFGNSITEKDWAHIWLSEGFATGMTNLYLEYHYMLPVDKRLQADREKIIAFSKTNKMPVVDTSVKGNYMKLLNINSYEKGGWVLYMLWRKLGKDIFWKGIRNYYAKYAGKNADTNDFMQEMEMASGVDLKQFFKQWLYTPGQPNLEVTWKYDVAKKEVWVTVTQNQPTLFIFDLGLAIRSATSTRSTGISIKERVSTFTFPSDDKPAKIELDPQTYLLFEGSVKEQ